MGANSGRTSKRSLSRLTCCRICAHSSRPRAAPALQYSTSPHRRWCEGNYDGWRHPGPWQVLADRGAVFAEGTWGSDWHPELAPQPGDVVIEQHCGQNGFANTDLDFHLKQRGIEKIIVVGMAANTCIEATARGGAELGYHVTLVRDATAAVSPEAMQAAHDLNGPTFAHAILTTDALIAVLSKA